MTTPPDTPAPARTWWQRQRGWLLAAAVFCVLSFLLPWLVNRRELDRVHPRTPIAATAEWNDYEGARWRLVDVRREPVAAGRGADYEHPDATLIVVDYEVIPGPGIDATRLDQCKGRLVDDSGREWEANVPAKVSAWMTRHDLGGTCGSRFVGVAARAVTGEPFAFTHVFLVPADVRPGDLHADLIFPPFTTTPRMGMFLRFTLPDDASP